MIDIYYICKHRRIELYSNIPEQTADNIPSSPFNLSLLEEEDDDVGVEKEEEE